MNELCCEYCNPLIEDEHGNPLQYGNCKIPSCPCHQSQAPVSKEPKAREWEEEFCALWRDIEDRRAFDWSSYNAMMPSRLVDFIHSLLQAREKEVLQGYVVSWDIADGGKNWEVQFWRKEEDGTMTLVTRLNKDSDDGGNFSLAFLTTKET